MLETSGNPKADQFWPAGLILGSHGHRPSKFQLMSEDTTDTIVFINITRFTLFSFSLRRDIWLVWVAEQLQWNKWGFNFLMRETWSH